jgi:hypothetical protein
MRKSYSVNGVVYNFTNVRMVSGMLYGKCITAPYHNEHAWLDSTGFQICGKRRVQAVECAPVTTPCDNSYTMWGGQLRDKLPHGARYYQMGRRW